MSHSDGAHASGNLELTNGLDQTTALVAAGLFGWIPMTAWCAMLLAPLEVIAGDAKDNGTLAALGLLGVVVLVVVFVAPPVVPVLVLRARQPKGARVTWDADGVTEWDGAWRRAMVPWEGMQAAYTVPAEGRIVRAAQREAIQLRDQATHACITLWDVAPEGAPVVRRRLCAARVKDLRAAVEAHGIHFSAQPDWSLARDRDRPRSRVHRLLGRTGYAFGALAPLIVAPAPILGVVLGVLAAAMLTFRARPIVAELRLIKARLVAQVAASATDANAVARRIVDEDKLLACQAEAFVRVGCVVLSVAATFASAYVVPWTGAGPRP
jgi:hypothetical protein